MTVEPLTGEESDRLIKNLLRPSWLSDDFRHRMAASAEGNPLFVEEMLGMLIDEERLRREEGRWITTDEVSTVPTPPSIQSLLAARIEQLPEAQRAILQRASVVGKVFWWGAVADLSPDADRTRVGSDLQDLVRKGMIDPDESSFVGHDAFRFRHILIRDAAYGSLPWAVRADLHERHANWILQAFGSRIDEYEEIVGYHLEQACRFRAEIEPSSQALPALRRRASDILSSSSVRAWAREDYEAAENLLSRSIQLRPPDDVGWRAQRLLNFVDLLDGKGEFSRAETVLDQAMDAARNAGDRALGVRVEIRRTRLRAAFDRTMTTQEGLGASERAAAVLGGLGDEVGSAEAWFEVGFFRQGIGRYREGELALERSRAFAGRVSGPWIRSIRYMDMFLSMGQGPETASDEAARLRDLLEVETQRRSSEALARLGLALCLAMQGRTRAAREYVDAAQAIFEDLGLKYHLANYVALIRAQVEMLADDPAAAELALRPGIEFLQAIGLTGSLADRAAFMSRILYQQGHYDEALAFVEMADRSATRDDMEPHLWFRGVRAKVLARRGNFEEAERAAREVVEMAERTDWLNFQGDVFMDLAEVLRLSGRSDEAADAAQQASERYERKGNVVAAGWALALLQELKRSRASSRLETMVALDPTGSHWRGNADAPSRLRGVADERYQCLFGATTVRRFLRRRLSAVGLRGRASCTGASTVLEGRRGAWDSVMAITRRP